MKPEDLATLAQSIGLSIVACLHILADRVEDVDALRAIPWRFRLEQLGETDLLSIDAEGPLAAFCPPSRRFGIPPGTGPTVKAHVLRMIDQFWAEYDAEGDDDGEDDEILTADQAIEAFVELTAAHWPALTAHVQAQTGEERETWAAWCDTFLSGVDLLEEAADTLRELVGEGTPELHAVLDAFSAAWGLQATEATTAAEAELQ